MARPLAGNLATAGLLAVALVVGCGSAGKGNFLDVGSDDGGGLSLAGSDAGPLGALDAHIEQKHIAVTIVTVGCAGRCADVQAVGTGGHPPYTYAWEDGTTNPLHQVCPTADTTYRVTVTDTASSTEVSRAAQTATASVTASIRPRSCHTPFAV